MTDDGDDSAQSADDRPAPLEDLARAVNEEREQRERASNTLDSAELFEQVDVADMDRDRLWDDLLDGEGDSTGRETTRVDTAGGVTTDTSDGQRETDVDSSESPTDTREHVVAKRSYCERCPHFSAPPEAVCEHEGTEIVEVVSIDQFLVRDCPVVDD